VCLVLPGLAWGCQSHGSLSNQSRTYQTIIMSRYFKALICSLLLFSITACLPDDTLDLVLGTPLPLTQVTPTRADAAPTRAATRPPKATPTTARRVKNQPGDFDFYVLSLSWSPDYCATTDNADPQQCSVGKRLGFVLHGLWPQYTTGYPGDCATTRLADKVLAKFPNLFPSASLAFHEWSKHGTCSGLTPEEYLAKAKAIKDSVTIPTAYQRPAKALRVTVDQLRQAFIDANPNFTTATLVVNCSGSGRFLKEIYVCFSLDGTPIDCSRELQKDEARSCRNADFLVRNVK
jgi:ribonuclease T2